MGITGMTVRPAGEDQRTDRVSSHFIDIDASVRSYQPTNHIHYGKGQTETS